MARRLGATFPAEPAAEVQPEYSWDQMVSMGVEILQTVANSKFTLGDLARHIPKPDLGKYALEIGMERTYVNPEKRLKELRKVAETFPEPERHCYAVSWEIFRLCAYQDDPQRWLMLANDQQLTVRQLRDLLRAESGRDPRPSAVTIKGVIKKMGAGWWIVTDDQIPAELIEVPVVARIWADDEE
jgi:hypothetical protein